MFFQVPRWMISCSFIVLTVIVLWVFIPRFECRTSSPSHSLPILNRPHYQLHHLTPSSFYYHSAILMSASPNSSSSFVTAPSSYFEDDESYGPIPIQGSSMFPCGPVCPTIPEVRDCLAVVPDSSIGPLLPEHNHDGRWVRGET